MTAPITTLRAKLHTEPHRYLLDDFLEYLTTKQGKENALLVALTVASVAGIVLIARYG